MTADIEGFAFNKAIARLYELTGAIGKAAPAERGPALRVLAQLTAPMTPHLAEEVWAMLGGDGLVAAAPWPEADAALLVEASVTLPVQVNGKRRAEIAVPAGSDAATVEALVLADPAVQRALNGGEPAPADRGARPDRECRGLSRGAAVLAALAAGGALAACGFTPLYAPGRAGGGDGRAGRGGGDRGRAGLRDARGADRPARAGDGADPPARRDARRSSRPASR